MSEKKSFKVAVLGIFTAVTAVLQTISYFIKIGNFNLSLVLVPSILKYSSATILLSSITPAIDAGMSLFRQ